MSWGTHLCAHEELLVQQAHSELKSEAVDYVSGLEDSREAPPPLVAFLIDATAEEGEIGALKASMLQAKSASSLKKLFT